jgi:Protein of unknown function (DUF3768)
MNSTTEFYAIAKEQLEALRKLAGMSADIFDTEGCTIIQAAEIAIENRIYSMSATRKESIVKQNDKFRRWPAPNTGKWVTSRLVNSLTRREEIQLVRLVRYFDDFNESNDPHGEHDSGSVEFKGEKYIWKFEYLDENYQNSSKDPSNPLLTKRVLTIVHSSEY